MGRWIVHILAGLLVPAMVFAEADGSNITRSVRLDFTPVEGASQYELQVQPFDDESKSHSIYGECCTLMVNLAPGRYRLRTKVFPDGPWGQWQSIAVHFKFPTEIQPASGQRIAPMFYDGEDVNFKWPAASGAKLYYFEIRNAAGKILFNEELNQTSLHMSLPVGQKYAWTVLPTTYAGEEKDVKLKMIPFEISKPDTAATKIQVQLHPEADAVRYEAELVRISPNGTPSEPALLLAKENHLALNLNPGSYRLRERSVDKTGARSNWSSATSFYIPYAGAEILTPKSGDRLFANWKNLDPVDVSWKPVPNASKYAAYIFDAKGYVREKKETSATQIRFLVPPGSAYSVFVQPYSFEEPVREVVRGQGTRHFAVSEFYDDHLDLNPEEPAHLYGWASYLLSNVNYLSYDYDNNSRTSDQIPGGSVELALGYWHKKTGLGLLGFADISGFRLDENNYLYYEGGILGGKRWVLSPTMRARLWAGFGRKQLPELVTHPGTSYVAVENIESNGVYVRGTLIGPLIGNFDWYLFTSYFHSIGQGPTPNMLPIDNVDSYQIGAYVSHPLGMSYKGRLGVSYRWDDGSYESDFSGDRNTVQISGVYLSFILEFALQAPELADD